MLSTTALIISMAAFSFIVFIIIPEVRRGSLSIKSKTAVGGQYGTAGMANVLPCLLQSGG